MLAMDVNDNAGQMMPSGVPATIASKLAPTEGWASGRRWRLLRDCFNAAVQYPYPPSGCRRTGGEQADPVALRPWPGR
ncbi:hypothetical protein GC387_05820 [Pseudomonas sp. MWU12-2323]|nr:hypothetical protein [Pseudomonas sp. MWU12-2323]